MPLYTSPVDIVNTYGRPYLLYSADRDNNGDIDMVAALVAIRDGEEECNSYLGTVYELPLPGITERDDPENNPNVPHELRRVARDISIYRLSPTYDVLTEEKRVRYEDAVKWLKAVASGLVKLPTIVPGTPLPTSGGGIQVCSNPRVMTLRKLRGLL